MNISDLKAELKQQLLKLMQQELDAAFDAVNEAHANATHEQSKPENQYDTLALEAAYLAHGQSERIAELQDQIAILNNFELREFSEDDQIAAGALIQLLNCIDDTTRLLWLLSVAGGEVLTSGEGKITTVTPEAPIAQELIGRYEGDEITLNLPAGQQSFEIYKIF